MMLLTFTESAHRAGEYWTAKSETRPTYHLATRTAELGFGTPDGRVVAQRLAPTFWNRGQLMQRGECRVLGVFGALAEAQRACELDARTWGREPQRARDVR